MSLGCSWLLFLAAASVGAAPLRVCADPGNLPYSNSKEQGFENELARMVARDLGRTLIYKWAPQRGRYLEKGLSAGLCDVTMGVATAVDEVWTTQPYYSSAYAFVARGDRRLNIHSFDDPALRKARIGVHVLQREDATAPPAQVLITRGLAGNIVWYKLYPDFSRPNPPAALIEAVERGEVDVAVVWGPIAGYFAKHAATPLIVNPIHMPTAPMAFSISMGVRRGDNALRQALNSEIERRRPEIRRLLEKYGVPLVNDAPPRTLALRKE